jgi:hypothetical protein
LHCCSYRLSEVLQHLTSKSAQSLRSCCLPPFSLK